MLACPQFVPVDPVSVGQLTGRLHPGFSALGSGSSHSDSNGYMTDHACRLSIRAFSPRKPRAGGDHSDRRAETGLEIHCRPRDRRRWLANHRGWSELAQAFNQTAT